MNFQKKIIPIESLLLDPENARHGEQDDQNAVLKWMSTGKDKAKVIILAQSIAKNGPNPSELPIVIPAGDGEQRLYIVLEGNRRIAVMKMLHDPDKCPDNKVRALFHKISKSAQVTLPNEMECVVYPDFETAAMWIQLRHQGEQQGAGIVNWGAKETEYFAKRLGRRGRYNAATLLLDYATNKNIITQEESNRIPITNVTRLINSPDVRREIGLHQREGKLSRVADEEYFDIAVGDMLKALSSGYWTVSKLKSRTLREGFIKKIKEEKNWGAYELKDETPITDESENVSKAGVEYKQEKKYSGRDPLKRKTPFSSSATIKILNKRLRIIFQELKKDQC
ncbi:MAG: hypothetical protein KKB20_07960 [Proteobacteria bacterium]|nr:hypothetical protein [Pseudomonadota bacterium]